MRTPDPRQSVVVGIFITIALAVLVALIAASGTLTEALRERLEVHTSFDQVNGLGPGDKVRMAGVRVGTVKAVAFDEDGSVRVDLRVDAEAAQHLHRDAVASVSTDGLIGNPIVVLRQGRQSGTTLQDGAEIRSTSTTSATDLLASLEATNDNLLAITNDVKQITAAITNEEGTVGRLLLDDSLYDSTSATMGELREASSALADFAGALDTEGTLAHDLVNDRTSYGKLVESVDQLKGVANGAASIVQRVEGSLERSDSPVGVLLGDEEAGGDVRTTLERLERSSALLEEDLRAVQENWLLRRYFRRKEREEEKSAESTE